jgi:trehalose 6-phosphate synthase
MSRVVLVSNRVLDLSKAARAGGVAVVLANIARARNALWFGWNGEVKPAGEADVIERKGRIATASLSEIDYAGYYLGYANSVLWPVFHNRLGDRCRQSSLTCPLPAGHVLSLRITI